MRILKCYYNTITQTPHKRMRLTHITTAKRQGFSAKSIHSGRRIHGMPALGYLKQKSSFFVATFSLFAFIAGNMMGDLGWHAFWASVLGNADDSLIQYTGTVSPIELVPDYTRWSTYGGNAEVHTFRQVPKDLLIPLPKYVSSEQKKGYDDQPRGDVYGVGNMGSYKDGAEGHGSHIGIDIRVPEGTPVRAIANGIVTQVENDKGGYGLYIVIRNPHMPDPDHPEKTTVLHSNYAHLSSQMVQVGDLVEKGQVIGLSGMTGFATGPHLHFQVDRDSAPWHPYWPFTGSEAREAGLTFTQAIDAGLHQERGFQYSVNPMLLVQANLPAVKEGAPRTTVVKASSSAPKKTVAQLRDERLQKRLTTRSTTTVVAVAPKPAAPTPTPAAPVVQTVNVASTETPVITPAAPVVATCKDIASIDMHHDRAFSGREWEKVRLTLLDAEGRTVQGECLKRDIALRTAFGEAEFKPKTLKASDFKDGMAQATFLPMGRRTVVIVAEPFGSLSQPMEYKEAK